MLGSKNPKKIPLLTLILIYYSYTKSNQKNNTIYANIISKKYFKQKTFLLRIWLKRQGDKITSQLKV